MSILITDDGARADDWRNGFLPLAALAPGAEADIGRLAVDLASTSVPPVLWDRLIAALPRVALIRVRLAHFADLGAFCTARMLRDAGYRGRLRACGAVLARQYRTARRAGFDEIELTAEQACRQPPEHWLSDPLQGLLRRAASVQGTPAPDSAPDSHRG